MAKQKNKRISGKRILQIATSMTVIVALVAGIWSFIGIPTPWTIVGELFEGEAPALSNTEVVLDTSAAMGEPFKANETKLQAAVGAIHQAGERDDEGLALRPTSPECDSEEKEPLVKFGKHHKGEILSVAENLHPEGKANITQALVEAVGDFRTNADFDGPGSTRRVLVFTTGLDECFEGDVAERIESELRGAKVSASFTLIALKASEEELAQLAELEKGLKSAKASVETRTPGNPTQLAGVVEEVKEEASQAIEENKEEKETEETISG
jgi:hypothetical protein